MENNENNKTAKTVESMKR